MIIVKKLFIIMHYQAQNMPQKHYYSAEKLSL